MLNLKNTLDGYLKNVEVIGNTIQDTNNLANIRSVGDKVEGQELYNISIQVDNGGGVSEVVEILSPVQLEKVGNVADRIICKNGVWGVEKNITTAYLTRDLPWGMRKNSSNFTMFVNQSVLNTGVKGRVILCNTLSVNSGENQDKLSNYNEILAHKLSSYSNTLYIALNFNTIEEFKTWLDDNPTYIKYANSEPQFIPIPHDQQVKLRTFAGQTNIAFNTEIAGQIKAQVPKSLGATVNTHTEQIADLHNSLDRVKKLEETTVSTVETESNFTTVDATSNGYFEDVKLEGKTLVNICPKPSRAMGDGDLINNVVISDNVIEITMQEGKYIGVNFSNNIAKIKPNTTYTVIANVLENTMTKGVFNLIESNHTTAFSGTILPLGRTGLYVAKTTTVDTFTLPRIQSMSNTLCISGEKVKFSLMVLEGDHTNNPPEFFEGLMSVGQDVEEFSVESVNENLISKTDLILNASLDINGNQISHVGRVCTEFIKVPSNCTLYFRGTNNSLAPNRSYVCFYDKDKNVISSRIQFDDFKILTPHNCRYVRFITHDDSLTNLNDVVYELYIGSLPNQYTHHQSNKKPLLYYNPTTETWEKPILREWDTIEKHSDGKYYYHKRSGEVVFNGSEVWEDFDAHSFVNRQYFHDAKVNTTDINVHGVICNNFNYGGVALGNGAWKYYKFESNAWSMFAKKSNQTLEQFKSELATNPIKVVYQLAQEEVYECANIDLMTYSGETNYIINSGAISPKSLLKVHNNISNVVKILQEKVSLLENTFIAGLKSVLSGDMYSLATILYPEDFEQNDNTEQDIMVIPE